MLRPDQFLWRLVRRSGSPGYGILTVAAPVWAGDRVVIGVREYVCAVGDEPVWPTGGEPRPVWLAETEDPLTPDAFLTALVAAINRDSLGRAWARRLGDTQLLVVGRGTLGELAVSSNFTEAGNGWGAVKLAGRRGRSTRPLVPWGASRVVEDWEAAQGFAVIPLRRWPRGFVVQVRGADGALLPFDGKAETLGSNVIVTAKGAVALEAGMLVTVIVY
jgi:hypothetical protein